MIITPRDSDYRLHDFSLSLIQNKNSPYRLSITTPHADELYEILLGGRRTLLDLMSNEGTIFTFSSKYDVYKSEQTITVSGPINIKYNNTISLCDKNLVKEEYHPGKPKHKVIRTYEDNTERPRLIYSIKGLGYRYEYRYNNPHEKITIFY